MSKISITSSAFKATQLTPEQKFKQKQEIYQPFLKKAFSQIGDVFAVRNIGLIYDVIPALFSEAIVKEIDKKQTQIDFVIESNIIIEIEGEEHDYPLTRQAFNKRDSRFNKDELSVNRKNFSEFASTVFIEYLQGKPIVFDIKNANSVDVNNGTVSIKTSIMEDVIIDGSVIDKKLDEVKIEKDFDIIITQPPFLEGIQLQEHIQSFVENGKIDEEILPLFAKYISIDGKKISVEVLQEYFGKSIQHIYILFILFSMLTETALMDLQKQLKQVYGEDKA